MLCTCLVQEKNKLVLYLRIGVASGHLPSASWATCPALLLVEKALQGVPSLREHHLTLCEGALQLADLRVSLS